MKYITIILLSVISVSCSSKTSDNDEKPIENIGIPCRQETNYNTKDYTNPVTTVAPHSQSESQRTRQDAFHDAFNTGKQLGISDALKGINNPYTPASLYTDDWIKEQFISGYIMGQAEANSNNPNTEEFQAIEYEDDNDYEYYYYDY